MKYSGYLTIAIGITLIFHSCSSKNNWPQFRGPLGNSISTETNLPVEWGNDMNILWKLKIPGQGWSSPIIWEDKVFVTTALRDKEDPKFKDDEDEQSDRNASRIQPDKDYKFEIYCLNKNTGDINWKDVAYLGKPGIPTHRDNTYASETPVTDGKYLYAYFGMTGLFCYDLEGNKVWEKNLGAFPMQSNWGTSSSPVLYQDLLILQLDNEENSQILALDKNTGEEKWRTMRNEISTWSTPFIWKNKDRIELVTGGKKTRSYNPKTGELIWELDMRGGRDISSPVANEEMIFVCNEERRDGGGTLFAVKAGASGDISLDSAENTNEWVAWTQPKSGVAMANPVLYKGYLYVLERRMGRVSCFNAQTGDYAYKREKLEGARAFWATPWAYDNKIFCLDDTGTTHVLQAGPDFNVLASNKLDDKFWSSTAIAGGTLIFRGVDYLYGIGKPK
ncbi:MAG: PQQ-binding-like beta-propeller repeat protein [Cyclobacteriaceae bacterium]|nr:PQQ-binding-like beta-propeller repeat protein [Cyclobacteriaceae bacterium]